MGSVGTLGAKGGQGCWVTPGGPQEGAGQPWPEGHRSQSTVRQRLLLCVLIPDALNLRAITSLSKGARRHTGCVAEKQRGPRQPFVWCHREAIRSLTRCPRQGQEVARGSHAGAWVGVLPVRAASLPKTDPGPEKARGGGGAACWDPGEEILRDPGRGGGLQSQVSWSVWS